VERSEEIKRWAYKRGLNTKVHLAIDKRGKPVRIIVSAGQEADCTYAPLLMAGLSVKVLIADRGYDVNQVIDTACARGIKVVIPSKRSRKVVRTYDTELYKKRHLIENVFRWIQQCRGSVLYGIERNSTNTIILQCDLLRRRLSNRHQSIDQFF
jgi:transposase